MRLKRSSNVAESDSGVRGVIERYLSACCTKRDIIRLAEIGFESAVQGCVALVVREAQVGSIDDAVLLVAMKEASTLIELYGREPQQYPGGRSTETAFAAGLKIAKGRYKKLKGPNKTYVCTLCRGPAIPCAMRHASGRSCA